MDKSKILELLIQSIASLQAQTMSLTDLFLDDFCLKNELSDADKIKLIDVVSKRTAEYQVDITAQLRARFDSSLGSVDELLEGL